MRTVSCALALAGLAGLQAGAASGLRIVTRQTHDGFVSETIAYVDTSRKRVDHRVVSPEHASAGRGFAQISRCDRRSRLLLDLDQRTYFSVPLDRSPLSRLFATAFSTRRAPAQPAIEVRVETTTVDTGERKTAFGLTARRVTTTRTETAGGAAEPQVHTTTDGWYVDLVTEPECEPRVLGNVYAHGVVLSGSSPAPRPVSVSFKNIGSRQEGFPIQTTTIRRQGRAADGAPPPLRIETIVTELATVPLDPALFEIPDGFRRADGFAAWIGDGLYAAWQAVKRAALSPF